MINLLGGIMKKIKKLYHRWRLRKISRSEVIETEKMFLKRMSNLFDLTLGYQAGVKDSHLILEAPGGSYVRLSMHNLCPTRERLLENKENILFDRVLTLRFCFNLSQMLFNLSIGCYPFDETEYCNIVDENDRKYFKEKFYDLNDMFQDLSHPNIEWL